MCACRRCGCRLTVGALLPAPPPLAAALPPAAHAVALHGTFAAQVGVVVSVVVHRCVIDRGAKASHGGVARQQRGGARGAHANHGTAQDVADAVWGPRLQLAVEARVELVERIWHRVLAHGGLQVRGELVQAVGEQERTLDVGIHVDGRSSASESQCNIQKDRGRTGPPDGSDTHRPKMVEWSREDVVAVKSPCGAKFATA